MILRCIAGNFHQGCDLFRNAGAQCTAIAYFAIVVIFLNSHFQGGSLDNYTPQVINETIIQGNQMYENIIQENNYPDSYYLAHNDLPSTISVSPFGNIESTVYPDMLYGIVGQNSYEHGSGALDIEQALLTGFQISDYLLCTVNQVTIAAFCLNNRYFIFDSHGRNRFGQFDNSGTAVLLQLEQTSLVDYLTFIYNGAEFNISPVVLQYPQTLSGTDIRNELHLSDGKEMGNESESTHVKVNKAENADLHPEKNNHTYVILHSFKEKKSKTYRKHE